MIEVIGVKFKSGGKMYYFAPGNLNPAEGSYVVVETARGPECGEVAARRHAVQDESITAPLKPILRLATAEDMQILEKNRAYMAEAFRVCQERIEARNLPMHLVDVECGFDSNKLIFYFTAESRVDFRELVKDLALAFHVRIELRQIGDRDEAKLLGGLGICGREFCCKGYLNNFQPISIKMAKEQGLALNPTKISGACGRLMCCLKNEEETYEELNKTLPHVGDEVEGNDGLHGEVESVSVLRQRVRILVEVNDEKELHEYEAADVTILRRRKRGQARPKFNRNELDRKPSSGGRRPERAVRNENAVPEGKQQDSGKNGRQDRRGAAEASRQGTPEQDRTGKRRSPRHRNRGGRQGGATGTNGTAS